MTVTATQTRRVFLEVDAHTIDDATAVLLDEGGDFLVIREESSGWAIRECSMDAAVGATSEAGPSCLAPPDYPAILGRPLDVVAAIVIILGAAMFAWGLVSAFRWVAR